MLLLWLLIIPFIGGLLCWCAERLGPAIPRFIALVTTSLVFCVSILLFVRGHYHLQTIGDYPRWAMAVTLPWVPRLGITFSLAVDGLSLLMVGLTGFVGVFAVLCSWREVTQRVGFFHLNLMWIIGAVCGVFLAVDLFLFFSFWEVMLVPMFFLIALWGHDSPYKTRVQAATKFFIYTQASGLLMLLAILGLVYVHYTQTHEITFNYMQLWGTEMSPALSMILMLGFFVAFAVKLPVVPLHGWLPDAHGQAPTAGSVDLAGILIKTAAYGLLRFALPLFPAASAQFAPIAMIFGVVSIYYGAIIAFSQTDIKRLVACSSISHMGFGLVGIYAGSHLALQGVVVMMVAHAFSAAGLFIVCGQIYERTHTRDMRQMSGLFGRVGSMSGYSLILLMASCGVPGTGNFVGEFMILFGSFSEAPWIVICAAGGLLFSAIYSLIILQRIYFGKPVSNAPLRRLSSREGGMLLLLVMLLFLVGLYPHTVMGLSSQPMAEVSHWFSHTRVMP